MDDMLTISVLEYQEGKVPLDKVRNMILEEAFDHLRRCSRKGEDEVSEFLLVFHTRIEGMLNRFRFQGLPFRHFLLRSLRWQWNTFRTERSRLRRQSWIALEKVWDEPSHDVLTEPSPVPWELQRAPSLTPSSRKRLVLLALKAAPYLDEQHLETISQHTGVELAWLQACQHRLRGSVERRWGRSEELVKKRSEAFYRRLMAEDDARREVDPERRLIHEHRARLYQSRLANLSRQQRILNTAPTHRELARLLGMPKGSVDSSLHHLKKELARVYIGGHEDPIGDE